ncbi:MAG: flavoprotein [Phycisphaerales bacterium]
MTNSSRVEFARAVSGRGIVVALTGGIACYKVAEIVSRLTQAEARVTVLMTDAATRFVTPLTLQALSGRPVYSSQWQHIESSDPQHINLARSADLMLIAPCTMDMLAKLVIGRTDDVVSLVCSAVDRSTTPVLLAPSMNAAMWGQASTQRNIAQLREDGFHLIGPDDGWQACRTSGPGRMSEPLEILDAIASLVSR